MTLLDGVTTLTTETGQFSDLVPSVVKAHINNGGELRHHMIFKANDPSNRLLYFTSRDGKTNWTAGPDTGQTTSAAPAIVLHKVGNDNRLVAVFIAEDASKRILWTTLDLDEDFEQAGWRFHGQVGHESAQWVSATEGTRPLVRLYFIANDPSNRILETEFRP
jgi:hypothetical protein